MKISPTMNKLCWCIIAKHKSKQVNWSTLGLDIAKEKTQKECKKVVVENVNKYVKVEGQQSNTICKSNSFATQSRKFGPTFFAKFSKRTNVFSANKITVIKELMESKKQELEVVKVSTICMSK